VALSDRVRSALRTGWHRAVERLTPLDDVAGTPCWQARCGDERYVVVLVPDGERAPLEAGLAAVDHLAVRGLAAGRPVRTACGARTLTTPDGVLSLLHDVPGRPLDAADPLDQQWWGDLLGRVHRELTEFAHPGLLRWHWIRPDAPHLDVEPWLRQAVAEAVAAITRLTVTDQLTYGVLHGDPLAGAFRMDMSTGRTGLVGWGQAATGPLAYDVAAAVLAAGGPLAAADFIEGYAAAGPVARDELEVALPVLMRFRWAARADRCARRLALGDRDRGELGPERAVLASARAALATA
jgi:homoserine kinase type II